MVNCPNCTSKITCGCQKRLASDGKYVCSKCISDYEEQLKKLKEELKQQSQTPQT